MTDEEREVRGALTQRLVREGRRFQWSRIRQSLSEDPTRQMELGLALFFFFLRGLFLVQFDLHTPTPVEAFLGTVYLNEVRLGVLCLFGAVCHLYGAGTNYPRLRALIALGGVGLSLAVIVAYQGSGPDWNPVAVVWMSVLLFEFYIMVRHYITVREEKATQRQTYSGVHA